MLQKWKYKLGILALTALVLSGAAAESVWGLSSLWRGMSRSDTVIVIDAGHGGADPGAVAQNGSVVEKEINLAIAAKLQAYLQEGGYTVIMTRTEDQEVSAEAGSSGGANTDGEASAGNAANTGSRKQADMRSRKQIMEDSGAQLMISIHQNSFTQTQYHGPQVFFQAQSPEAAALALLVQGNLNQLAASGGAREAKANDSYYVLKNASMPAILVECGFVSNPEEAARLTEEAYQKKIAWGIYCGIEKYLQSDAF